MNEHRKVALGLFHFNPHWGLQTRSGVRHCLETLGPLLRSLKQRPLWKVDIEISGSGLEFLFHHFPELFCSLRRLVEAGQVELISSQYTPAIWPAFPGDDLSYSVELNQRCLAKLGLPWTPVFFAQEAFFGEGVFTLQDFFDVVVCKDDYLDNQYDLPLSSTIYQRDGLKVIVASNHIVMSLYRLLDSPDVPREIRQRVIPYRAVLESVPNLRDPHAFPGQSGCVGGVEWKWYHCGDGNHFGSPNKPDMLDYCYFDPVWSGLFLSVIDELACAGYEFTTISGFVQALDYSGAPQLPLVVEGGWNPRSSEGVLCWMGRNDTAFEDDATVLASISRARARLAVAEQLSSRELSGETEPLSRKLDQAWQNLLVAEVSDALGWRADAHAVALALGQADQALAAATTFLNTQWPGGPEPLAEVYTELLAPCAVEVLPPPSPVEVALVGADGHVDVSYASDRLWLYDVRLQAQDRSCAVRFPVEEGSLAYCPSGCESRLVPIPASGMKGRRFILPLANGLVRLLPGTFLIKECSYCHVAADVNLDERTLSFGVHHVPAGRSYHWRFFVSTRDHQSTLRFANRLNAAGFRKHHSGNQSARLASVGGGEMRTP